MTIAESILLATATQETIYKNLKNVTKKEDEDKMDLVGLPPSIFEPEEEIHYSNEESKIVQFYKNKCILVTGATGFFGKLLVEKLLRTCPDLDTIYIVVRDKKGKDIHTRIDELYNDVVSNIYTYTTIEKASHLLQLFIVNDL